MNHFSLEDGSWVHMGELVRYGLDHGNMDIRETEKYN